MIAINNLWNTFHYLYIGNNLSDQSSSDNHQQLIQIFGEMLTSEKFPFENWAILTLPVKSC